ncbi:hypothetical protein TNCV_2995141 [Trichonephila clavipes]|nr:hypothetical protein TNCV_2995141 [Trichonephila clavipes]
MRWNMQLDMAKSELASSTKSPTQNVCLSCFVKTISIKKTLLDNFKRAVMEAKHVNEFRPNEVMWEKTSKGLLRNPDRLLKNTDKRMIYIYGNLFFAKKNYLWLANGEIRRNSLYSNDACAHVHLRIASLQSQVPSSTQCV